MPFRVLVTLKDQTVKEDFRIYHGSLPTLREVVTLEIDGHVMQVRVTAISGEAKRDVSAQLIYRVHGMEL